MFNIHRAQGCCLWPKREKKNVPLLIQFNLFNANGLLVWVVWSFTTGLVASYSIHLLWRSLRLSVPKGPPKKKSVNNNNKPKKSYGYGEKHQVKFERLNGIFCILIRNLTPFSLSFRVSRERIETANRSTTPNSNWNLNYIQFGLATTHNIHTSRNLSHFTDTLSLTRSLAPTKNYFYLSSRTRPSTSHVK